MIKAAIESNLPPVAVILDEPDRAWTSMDTRLIKAYWLKQEYGTFPPWIDQSDRVQFEVRTITSRSAAAIEKKQERVEKESSKRGGAHKYGQRYYAVPQTIDAGPMPTIEEWIEDRARKSNGRD